MKLVVDTNVLITYLWRESVSRTLFVDQRLLLFAPEYALEEINKHRDEIRTKAGISEKEYHALLEDLALSIAFVPLDEYATHLKEAVGKTPDPNDVDFVALSLALGCPLWTNDKRLKESEIAVFDTAEIVELLTAHP